MNKEQDIDNQLYKYLSPDLYCYVHNYIVDLKMQITQLTNNWNELEEWLDKIVNITANIDEKMTCKNILDKMKETKESKYDSSNNA